MSSYLFLFHYNHYLIGNMRMIHFHQFKSFKHLLLVTNSFSIKSDALITPSFLLPMRTAPMFYIILLYSLLTIIL